MKKNNEKYLSDRMQCVVCGAFYDLDQLVSLDEADQDICYGCHNAAVADEDMKAFRKAFMKGFSVKASLI